MSKIERNFWLDVAIFVSLTITTLTGYFLWLVIPHRLDALFLGASRKFWVLGHVFFGLIGLACIVIHIVWHWGWLKALRGRALGSMPKKVRANRVVNRTMWITYIATNLFGVIAWVIQLTADNYKVGIPDRLHVVFGVAWTILTIAHLVLHWKWINSSIMRLSQVSLRSPKGIQEQEII
jgi:hypothetical protein